MDQMPGNVILRSEAMKIVMSGQPITMEFVTADRRRGTGGDLMLVKNWMKILHNLPADKIPGKYSRKYKRVKERHNYDNRTFSIFNPADPRQHPVTVHFRLIHTFFGKTVLNG